MRQEILPVWIGARRTKMLRLVGRKGDGWLLFLSWVGECLGRGNRVIDEAAEESGRAGLRNRAAVSGDSATVAPMEITRLQPDGLVVSPAFSHGAVVPAGATTIYVGGQNGVDADGKIISDDVAEQSARAIDNASTALEAAGAALADVVQWTVFMAEDADLNAAYEAIGPRLAGPGAPPLVTMARVAALGVPGALVEVSAIAAVVPG